MTDQGYKLTVVVEALEPPELFEWFADLRAALGMTVVPTGPGAGAAVLKALPRDIDPVVARGWVENHKALTDLLRCVLLPPAEITSTSPSVINCDATPRSLEGLEVDAHQHGGEYAFDASHVELHLNDGQRHDRCIRGDKLHKRLSERLVLNANVLDHLLDNPNLIPDEWRLDERGCIRNIVFWGTIYRDRSDDRYVRYLYWRENGWDSGAAWLGFDFDRSYPAALHVR